LTNTSEKAPGGVLVETGGSSSGDFSQDRKSAVKAKASMARLNGRNVEERMEKRCWWVVVNLSKIGKDAIGSKSGRRKYYRLI
jgi:hypothetical protein